MTREEAGARTRIQSGLGIRELSTLTGMRVIFSLPRRLTPSLARWVLLTNGFYVVVLKVLTQAQRQRLVNLQAVGFYAIVFQLRHRHPL